MKKVVLAIVALGGLVLQSCVSGTDWKCKCTKDLILGTQLTHTYMITDQPKGDAQKICDFYKTEYNWDTCELSQL